MMYLIYELIGVWWFYGRRAVGGFSFSVFLAYKLSNV